MLKTPIARRVANQDDSLIPLINVVFLMLIFFMVAGQITATDGTDVETPDSISQVPLESEQLKVVINQQGDIYIDGQQKTIEQLSEIVLVHVTGLKNNDTGQVVIKADSHLAVDKLQAILKQIKQAGVNSLSLMTSQVDD